MNPKTELAFPASYEVLNPGHGKDIIHVSGMSQYAYVAMKFHAARMVESCLASESMSKSFDATDRFFAELAKRTK